MLPTDSVRRADSVRREFFQPSVVVSLCSMSNRQFATRRPKRSEGDAQQAFQLLKPALAFQREELPDGDFVRGLNVFARICDAIPDADLGNVIRRVWSAKDDPTALFDAGYALYERRLYSFGANLLWRVNRLAPG